MIKTPLAYHTCTDEEMDLYKIPRIDFTKAKRMKCLDKKDLFGNDLNILLERNSKKYKVSLHIEYRFVGDLKDENI
jgi:hypothetical protein